MHADVAAIALLRRVGLDREVGIAGVDAGRRELRDRAVEERVALSLRASDRRGGRDDLGSDAVAAGQMIDRGLVEPGEGAQRAGDQVKLVLDDQVDA